jgi:hypothetical protein
MLMAHQNCHMCHKTLGPVTCPLAHHFLCRFHGSRQSSPPEMYKTYSPVQHVYTWCCCQGRCPFLLPLTLTTDFHPLQVAQAHQWPMTPWTLMGSPSTTKSKRLQLTLPSITRPTRQQKRDWEAQVTWSFILFQLNYHPAGADSYGFCAAYKAKLKSLLSGLKAKGDLPQSRGGSLAMSESNCECLSFCRVLGLMPMSPDSEQY